MTGTRRSRSLGAAALVLAAVAVLGACSGGGSTSPSDRPSDVADQGYQSGDGSVRTWAAADRSAPVVLTGTDFEGAAVDVSAWRGDVVVVNTWYAGCPPCRAEAPDLVAVASDYAADGVHLIGINGVDDAGTAQAFQRTFAVPYPSVADTDGHAVAALQGAVPVQAVPTTVVLDRDGRVFARVLGQADGTTLRALVDDALAQTAAAAPTMTGGPAATGPTGS